MVDRLYGLDTPHEFPGALYHVTSRGNARLSRLATARFRDEPS